MWRTGSCGTELRGTGLCRAGSLIRPARAQLGSRPTLIDVIPNRAKGPVRNLLFAGATRTAGNLLHLLHYRPYHPIKRLTIRLKRCRDSRHRLSSPAQLGSPTGVGSRFTLNDVIPNGRRPVRNLLFAGSRITRANGRRNARPRHHARPRQQRLQPSPQRSPLLHLLGSLLLFRRMPRHLSRRLLRR